jgi:Zn-dependent peptidase ImmA (M78 family)
VNRGDHVVRDPVYKVRDRLYGWKVDPNGVPILSATEIEEIADDFLERFDPEVLQKARPTNLSRIIHILSKDYGVTFNFKIHLGKDKDGNKILGRYFPAYRSIYIDSSLLYHRARWKFTLVHEIGHFIFHSKIESIDDSENGYSRDENYKTLSLHHLDSKNPRTWREWQANRFGGAILVPRFTLGEKVIDLQSRLGVLNRLGKIYLDHQPINNRDFKSITYHLSRLYGVSIAVINVRLRNLDIIVNVSESSRVSSIIQDVFRDIV